jgi:hypothetical protein
MKILYGSITEEQAGKFKDFTLITSRQMVKEVVTRVGNRLAVDDFTIREDGVRQLRRYFIIREA